MTRSITRQVLSISLPNTLAQLLGVSVGFIATFVAAKLGTHPLAALALGFTLYLNFLLFMVGINYGLSILISKHFGANEPKNISLLLKQGCYLTIFLAIPLTVLLRFMQPILLALGQDPTIVTLTQGYLNGLSYGLWALFIATTLRQFLLAIGHPKILNLFASTGLIFCVTGFYAFGLGHFGFKAMGIAGLGLGMSVASMINLGFMLIYVLSKSSIRQYFFIEPSWSLNLISIKAIFKLGFPISINMLTEIIASSILVLIIGYVNHTALAAYQIVSQLMFIPLMFPFSINQATAILTSRHLGRKQGHMIKSITKVSNIVTLIPVGISSLLFWFIPGTLVDVFIQHQHAQSQALIPLATHMLMLVGVFQLIDCTRLIAIGALRGLHDVTKPLIYSVIGFCLINTTLAVIVGIVLHLGVLMIWLCSGAGYIIVTILVYHRLNHSLMPYAATTTHH